MRRQYFASVTLPDANELTMNALGASATFDANTPISHFLYSLDTYNNYLGQNPANQRSRPDIIEVIPGPDYGNMTIPDDGLTIDPRTGRAIPNSQRQDYPARTSPSDVQSSGKIASIIPNIPGPFEQGQMTGELFQKLFGKDASKDIGIRIVITVIAIALLIIGATKL